MILVESSTVKGFEKNQDNLIVEFNNGSRYEYLNVPDKLIEEFNNAPSKGRFLNAYIKNKFLVKKLILDISI